MRPGGLAPRSGSSRREPDRSSGDPATHPSRPNRLRRLRQAGCRARRGARPLRALARSASGLALAARAETLPMGRLPARSAHAGRAPRTAAFDGCNGSPSFRRGRAARPLAPGRQLLNGSQSAALRSRCRHSRRERSGEFGKTRRIRSWALHDGAGNARCGFARTNRRASDSTRKSSCPAKAGDRAIRNRALRAPRTARHHAHRASRRSLMDCRSMEGGQHDGKIGTDVSHRDPPHPKRGVPYPRTRHGIRSQPFRIRPSRCPLG